jgi:crotonobetainyl-CoA:carnitine CoA-transferase CaiB-like acyl-CoA transferase
MNQFEALAKIRVLDLATNIAGPFAAMILGDLGADVVKIERAPGGDDTRALPPHYDGQATVFMAVNRNKRSVLLDLKQAEGRAAVLKLAERADVIIESFPPEVGDKLSLTYHDFRAMNSKLIVCSISAFGDGPIGGAMPGYDALVQAVSGMMSFTGESNGSTVRLAPSLLDLTTGMWAAIGVLAALMRRGDRAQGEHIRVALLDSAFTLMCHQVLSYLATGVAPSKLGSGAPAAVPYRVFRALDGEFMLATATDAQWVRLCRLLGLAHLVEDQRLASMTGRIAARGQIDEALQEQFLSRPLEPLLKELSDAGISCGRVNGLDQALELAVTRERQLLARAQSDAQLPLLRLPILPSLGDKPRSAPKLGEHTMEVLREAGYDEETARRLNREA